METVSDSDDTVHGGSPGRTPVKPTALDDEAALDDLIEGEDLVLVEFYTEGCSKCEAMVPVLGNVARVSPARVALCNPRDDPPLIERFAISSVPTLVLFVDGEEVARLSRGFVGTEDVVAFVEEHA